MAGTARAQDRGTVVTPPAPVVTGEIGAAGDAGPPDRLSYSSAQQPPVELTAGDLGFVRVTAENGIASGPRGYAPLRVYLENSGPRGTKVELELRLPGGVAVTRRTVEVPAGTRTVTSIPVFS